MTIQTKIRPKGHQPSQRALAVRSWSRLMRIEATGDRDAYRTALHQHFDDFPPAIVEARSRACSLRQTAEINQS